jgi:gamma-glutamylcysteine synthetase
VQLDFDYDELPLAIRAYSNVEPIKALLFNNSVLLDDYDELACCRDMFWENSTHGINPHNVGMFDCDIDTVEDLQKYIESTSMYCLERDGKYINFEPVPVMKYFESDSITGEYYEDGSYHKITFAPQIEDLEYLRTFKFEDLTYRGTIEFRSVCCQPVADVMTVAAFHLGLRHRLEELDELLRNDRVLYHHGLSATELRRLFVRRRLPEFVEKDEVFDLAKRVLDLAKSGLMERGCGEEKFLEPLYNRIERQMCPAVNMIRELQNHIDIEDVILEYAAL